MAIRSVRWDGTVAAWEAVTELCTDLDVATFRNEDGTLYFGTCSRQRRIPIGRWIVRRGDAVEVWSSQLCRPSAPRV